MKNFVFPFTLLLICLFTTAQEPTKRPQEPTLPYPYLSEDITFPTAQGTLTLAGTLTLPTDRTDFPIVILISGSSPHNRDEEIAGHKPFLVLADHLTRNGIGVLRYDDRGVGGSTGTYEIAAYEDRAIDVESAMAYLKTRKDLNNPEIGLIGHSEGGLIAPIVASRSTEVAFITLLAAPGIPGYDMILLQTALGNKAQGIGESETQKELAFLKGIFDEVISSADLAKSKSELSNSLKEQPDQLPNGITADNIDAILQTFTSSWFYRILTYDPADVLEKVNCPVLALNGSKDLQIPAKENLAAIRAALQRASNEEAITKELPHHNHLFQEAQTGLEDEFEIISQTISLSVLQEITSWIHSIK